MTNRSLRLLAGSQALNEVRANGLSPARVKVILGASGGPKWLVLSRLDQYLNKYFLADAHQPITLLGSSVGAWRMALYAAENAHDRFMQLEAINLDHRYRLPITPTEVNTFINRVLVEVFTDDCRNQILASPNRHLQVVAVRNRRYLNGRSKASQLVSLSLAATGNLLSPAATRLVYPRVIISRSGQPSVIASSGENVALDAHNLPQALIASGAIPIAMDPIQVPGSKNRWHWDGAIADYHFGGPFNVSDGLILYPHFSARVVPGWFDKVLPWRRPKGSDYSRVVMMVPSDEFIAKLPYGKIPDRHDISRLSHGERKRYWRTVVQETNALVEDFHNALEVDGGRSLVQPLEMH